jgi:PAS domain S-box-containing protein
MEMARYSCEAFRIFDNQRESFVYVSPAYERIWGHDTNQLLSDPWIWLTAIHPDDGRRVREIFMTVLRQGGERSAEYRLLGHHGETRWIADRFVSLDSSDGRSLRVACIAADITDKHTAQEENRRRQQFVESVLYHAPDAIVTLDPDHCVLDWNPGAVNIFGYSREEAVGRELDELIAGDDKLPEAKGKTRQVLSGQRVEPFESIRYRKDRSPVSVIAAGSPLMVSGALAGVVVVYTNISALKAAQAEKEQLLIQLQQAQKMEAIGTLAGGIAHDFNNLLMGIQGRNALMLEEIAPQHPFHEHLRGVEAYVRRASELTRQLLGYARGGKYEIVPLDLNEVIAQSLDLFARTRRELFIETDYHADLWTVEADQSQIEQVLLNLFVNAWQAMPDGGVLKIATENCFPEEKMIRPLGLAPGKYVKTTVADTGIGMEPSVLGRIFDPFFSTKTRGLGTGLGLASAYGIVKHHGGMIAVESCVGKGSSFAILLPASGKKPLRTKSPAPRDLQRGNEKLLLVDDEPMILEVGGEMLKRLGYAVLKATSGQEALEIYSRHGKSIDLVILDMIMPNMGGGEVFKRLKAADPEVAVLLSSGYSIDEQTAQIIAQGSRGFIQKPFNLLKLSQKLRQAIEL